MSTLPASQRHGKKAATASNVVRIRTPYAEAARWVETLGRLLGQPVASPDEARALHEVVNMAIAAIEEWGDARMLLRALRLVADAVLPSAEVVQIGGVR